MTSPAENQDLELLSRYLDGELPAADSRKLETRLHSEQELQRTLVRLQELNQQLRDSLTERATIPEATRLLLESDGVSTPAKEELSGNSSNVLPFPGAGVIASARPRANWPVAIAASLVAAVAVGLVMNTSFDATPALPGNDRLVSAALEQETSGGDWLALSDGRELQSVLTFPHEDGRWCREYLLRGGDADWRAVACREDNRWVTQAAGLESYLEPTDAYIPAGASDAEPVAVFISRHAADIALGLDEEIQLISDGWQR